MMNIQKKKLIYMSMALLLVIMCLLLTGCGSKNDSQTAQLPALQDKDPEGANDRVNADQSDDVVSVDTPFGEVQTARQQKASGQLSDGVNYVLYQDGELMLYGSPISCRLSNEQKLKSQLDKIYKLSFGEGVTAVGEHACEGLDKVEQVDFSKDTTIVAEYAFSNCSALETVTWGGLESIGEYAFNGCTSLRILTLNENMRSISSHAFDGCTGLKTVELGDNIQQMGMNVFSGCSAMNTLRINADISDYAFPAVLD